MISDLVTWLREQIADDRDREARVQRRARELYQAWQPNNPYSWEEQAADVHDEYMHAARLLVDQEIPAVLAQCESHEAVLAEHWDVNEGDCAACVTGQWGYPTHGGSSPQQFPCKTVRALGLAFQNRGGYREEWRP